MPYPNIKDPAMIAKMDKCVTDVMAQGHDKQSAIAICYTSIAQEQGKMNPIQLLWQGVTELFKPHLQSVEQRAPYPWDKCIADQLKAGYSQDSAEKICGAIKNRLGDDMLLPDGVTLEQVLQVAREGFEPKESRSIVIRQANGQYRWFGVAATAVINRDNMIDSRELFDSFIKRIQETKVYPKYDVLHFGEPLTVGQADYVIRDGALCFASGTFYDDEFSQTVARTLEQDKDNYWGHSIAFTSGDPDILNIYGLNIPVFTQGNLEYISIVPRSRAASLFTDVTVQARSKTMMNEQQFEELVKLVGKDLAEKKREELNTLNRTITDAGLIIRVSDGEQSQVVESHPADVVPTTPVVGEQRAEEHPTEETPPEQRAITAEDLQKLTEAMSSLNSQMQTMMEAISAMQQEQAKTSERIAKIETPIEQRIAQVLADAPNPSATGITRPRETRGTGSVPDGQTTLERLHAQHRNQ